MSKGLLILILPVDKVKLPISISPVVISVPIYKSDVSANDVIEDDFILIVVTLPDETLPKPAVIELQTIEPVIKDVETISPVFEIDATSDGVVSCIVNPLDFNDPVVSINPAFAFIAPELIVLVVNGRLILIV